MTLHEIERALDEGRISALMSNGNWWKVRRNGRTQLWKTRPDEFRIPVKMGFRTCDEFTHHSDFNNGCEYRVDGVDS